MVKKTVKANEIGIAQKVSKVLPIYRLSRVKI